ncbi:hypothetical protein DYB31_015868, partial [Aphanomyces astaci]
MGQGDERGFVYNAPALPDPPSLNVSTKSERRTFIHQYNKYLDQVNTLQLNGPFVMPVSACMDDFIKKRVAMWDMANRDYRGVTETEWAAWLSKAFEEEHQDLEMLKKRLTTAIRFDTTILDADSRLGKMLDNLMQALERDDQAWVVDQEGKTVVDIMVKAIKPVGLQKSVQRQLALQHNKPLKSNKDSAKNERKKATCLKCGSENHKVVNCHKCAPGESERLLNPSAGREATIEGIVSVTTTLLDTGSDVTLVTAAPALKVDRQVQFKLVTLDTPCGPFALRGLKVGVDSSSNAAELLISRAVMERLGFSEDELLSLAFAKQEVWDVSD